MVSKETTKSKKMKKGKDAPLEVFIEEEAEAKEDFTIEIPKQYEFFKVPRRFGSIPVDQLPLGCDSKEQYYKVYPRISLPFQSVERISFGHPKLEPNRLLWGDNLHIMRLLPSNSVDLIYIDPPFFSGRNYNVIFGDQNEVRSFTDIWDGGMPGYSIWLNARLLEMKRLLKPTGSIFVHLDWHASHYIKVEMDNIFGYENFLNEIVWCYKERGISRNSFNRKHDVILFYAKEKGNHTFNYKMVKEEYSDVTIKKFKYVDEKGRRFRIRGRNVPEAGDLRRKTDIPIKLECKYTYRQYLDKSEGSLPRDWFETPFINQAASERIGYPTQKPEKILEKFIKASSNEGDVVADFFCGGGTTPVVAQKLGRRWIACDISRIAVAVTRDRLLGNFSSKDKKGIQQSLVKTPDISIEHWGVYEVESLTKMTDETFKHFIIQAYNGRIATGDRVVHGYKQGVPLYVGSASQEKQVGKDTVLEFAKAITTQKGKHQGTMLAWAFAPSAWKTAEQLALQQAVAVDFVKISLVPIDSEEFKEHVTSKHTEYKNLLKFILPPEVRLTSKRVSPLTYEFDVSESVAINLGGKIINVQWDFDHKGRFVSTPGYIFAGLKDKKPILKTTYKFPSLGNKKIACRVQDDEGGQKITTADLEVR